MDTEDKYGDYCTKGTRRKGGLDPAMGVSGERLCQAVLCIQRKLYSQTM